MMANEFQDEKNIEPNPLSFHADEKGVIYKTMSEMLHDSMIPYTECVVMDRALPRVEDGLKPVQRRILFDMLENGFTPDKPYRKSANIVGDCLGAYHPHGDSSVYDAMCRMAQPWILREPLVEGQGNFGSVDGDSPAAYRYTEARLAPLALELMRDIGKDTVRWSLTFDDRRKEPDMFPGRFPNLLVNGASGIAVGVATNIPPHNLGETIDGVVAYIDNPKISIEELMKIIKAPDFPTGGEIISVDGGLEQAYRTGKGKIIIRSKVGIEKVGDKVSLIISEIPYQVNKAQLLIKIAELKEQNKDKLSCITEIRDESDINGMRAVIRLKKDANPNKVLEYLYKSTNLQVTFGINMVAIAGGKPKLLNLLEIISYYSEYQREVIVRRSKYELEEAKERAHILQGLVIAIKNIDEVIKIIKKSASTSEAKTKLRERFKLSERQAQAILDMRLARLVHLEVAKIEEELAGLEKLIAHLEKILSSKRAQYDLVKKEILEIKKNFGNKRRSVLLSDSKIKIGEIKDEKEEEVSKNFVLSISAGGTIKKVSPKNYSMSQKELTDSTTLTDLPKVIETFSSNDILLILTNKGNAIKRKVGDLKECKWRDKGFGLDVIEKLTSLNENPIAFLKVPCSSNVIFMTKKGIVKISPASELVMTKAFYPVCKLSDDDEVISVQVEEIGKPILMMTQKGMALNFDKKEVPVQGRVSGGVRGINLDDNDSVIFASQINFEQLVIVSENGYIKKLNVSQFPVAQRYRKGLKYISFAKGCENVFFIAPTDKNTVLAVDFGLKILPLDTKKVPEGERLTSGNEIIKKNFFSITKLID